MEKLWCQNHRKKAQFRKLRTPNFLHHRKWRMKRIFIYYKLENEKDPHILQSSYHTSSKQQQRNEGTSCHDGEFRLKLNVFKKYQEFKQQSSLIKKNGKDDEEESAMEINGNDEESEEREEVYGD